MRIIISLGASGPIGLIKQVRLLEKRDMRMG
jgi:hypothetical protein